jgi:hypothetical protein
MRKVQEMLREGSSRPTVRACSPRAWLSASLALLPLIVPAAVQADDYDPQKAGHPVRIVAYVAHPVGVILDLLIFRPAHWIGSLPWVDEFFGHERYDD